MSSKNHVPSAVLRAFVQCAIGIAENLHPLKVKTDPKIAATLGFLTGGIGLGLIFRNIVDAIVPFLMLVALAILGIPVAELTLAFTPFFWAAYGYQRAKAANEKLDAKVAPATMRPAEAPSQPPPIPVSVEVSPVFSPEIRLRKLDELLREGFLTPVEHQTKRSQILSTL
jgi:hypothetical protein